jgi:hypothetical protein
MAWLTTRAAFAFDEGGKVALEGKFASNKRPGADWRPLPSLGFHHERIARVGNHALRYG